jgi:hypothetical protein
VAKSCENCGARFETPTEGSSNTCPRCGVSTAYPEEQPSSDDQLREAPQVPARSGSRRVTLGYLLAMIVLVEAVIVGGWYLWTLWDEHHMEGPLPLPPPRRTEAPEPPQPPLVPEPPRRHVDGPEPLRKGYFASEAEAATIKADLEELVDGRYVIRLLVNQNSVQVTVVEGEREVVYDYGGRDRQITRSRDQPRSVPVLALPWRNVDTSVIPRIVSTARDKLSGALINVVAQRAPHGHDPQWHVVTDEGLVAFALDGTPVQVVTRSGVTDLKQPAVRP